MTKFQFEGGSLVQGGIILIKIMTLGDLKIMGLELTHILVYSPYLACVMFFLKG